MCYTTDSHVDIKTELTTTLHLGYRADCNNIPVNISSLLLKPESCMKLYFKGFTRFSFWQAKLLNMKIQNWLDNVNF